MHALATITDPEVGLDIVSMGLLYNARQTDDTLIIDMTMTTPYCPLAPFFTQEVSRVAAATVPDAPAVVVNFVFTPLWSQSMIDHGENI